MIMEKEERKQRDIRRKRQRKLFILNFSAQPIKIENVMI